MRYTTLAVVLAAMWLLAWPVGNARAQVVREPVIRQPFTFQQTSFQLDDTALAGGGPQESSPSDIAAPPVSPFVDERATSPIDRALDVMGCGPLARSAASGCCCGGQPSCCCCGGQSSCCCACDDEPWRLIGDTVFGISITGWVAGGFTTTSGDPLNPPGGTGNLPVAFNYRSNAYQLNQLYVVMERPTDTGGCGFDLGGRVDLLYGEDYIFTQAAGLETRQDGTNRWNARAGGTGIGGTARLGLAMPQVYGEVALNKWKLKLGHFYTIIGYETVTAPDNFFYSHAYTMLYGEPFTHTGGLLSRQIGDQWMFHAGIVNGWDKFDAVNDRAALLTGFSWTCPSGRTSLALGLVSGDEDGTDPPNLGNRTMYSIVFSHQLTCRLQYVLQHDFGNQNFGDVVSPFAGGRDAEWYGLNQYLFYRLTDRCDVGVRYEWFNDQNGTRVLDFGGSWHEVTLGLNWTPYANAMIRPEVRWDAFDPHNPATPPGPFDEFTRRSQFTAAFDVIVLF